MKSRSDRMKLTIARALPTSCSIQCRLSRTDACRTDVRARFRLSSRPGNHGTSTRTDRRKRAYRFSGLMNYGLLVVFGRGGRRRCDGVRVADGEPLTGDVPGLRHLSGVRPGTVVCRAEARGREARGVRPRQADGLLDLLVGIGLDDRLLGLEGDGARERIGKIEDDVEDE